MKHIVVNTQKTKYEIIKYGQYYSDPTFGFKYYIRVKIHDCYLKLTMYYAEYDMYCKKQIDES